MDYENIKYEVREGGVAVVTIDRPKVLNALNGPTLSELGDAFTRVAQDPEVRVAILTGGGEKAFVAGADISQMVDLSPIEANEFAGMGQRVLSSIENCPKVVIAAVNGFALGGGTEIAMACDFIYASDKAMFGQPEIKLGIIPGFGGTQRLPRLVGKAMAKELVLVGENINAEEALRIGLVNQVVPADELMQRVLKLAGKIAAKGQVAVRLGKECINRGVNIDLSHALAFEREAFAVLCSTDDQVEGMQAFLNKRKPEFKDR
ncbi:MAG: enoyl-CoA hydratase-related protein [Candidatus Alcyoniella australis]|nr:enoyl-CoA hydratase-related protein [Candidatus Alcyoniella australis]